jgi:hypothetical protein
VDAFMLGLKLENNVKGAQQCQESLIYALDDLFYLFNNVSDFRLAAWEAPIMNMSKAIAGNFSNSLLNCFIAYDSFVGFMLDRYSIFKSDIANFLLAYLFNFMGSALRMKSIFDEINDDIEQQFYADIAT